MSDNDLSKSQHVQKKYYKYNKTLPSGKQTTTSGWRAVTQDRPGRPPNNKGKLRKALTTMSENEAAILLAYLEEVRAEPAEWDSAESEDHDEMPTQPSNSIDE